MDSETPFQTDIAIAPIVRRTLHVEVLTRLRDMIIEGRLEPGARINETVVGRQLGVSRTPLREAIKTLVSEGLVAILPAKGAVVRSFSQADLAKSLETLKILEQNAGRLACERASDAEIAHIESLHSQMLTRYAARERLDYFKLNQMIHSAIVAASGNHILAELHGTLQARVKRARYVGNGQPEKWSAAVEEHDEMIRALKGRNADALAQALGAHMDRAFERVRYLYAV